MSSYYEREWIGDRGAVLEGETIFGEPCFQAYDNREYEIGCFRSKAAAVEAINRKFERFNQNS